MIVRTSFERIHLGGAVSDVYDNDPISSLDDRLMAVKDTRLKRRDTQRKNIHKMPNERE